MKAAKLLALVVVTAVWIAPTVLSEVATSVEMEQACNNWLVQITYEKGVWAGSQNPVVIGSHDIAMGDTILARWYDISPRGYVLVSALKEMTPVKAYSDESNLTELQEGGFIALVRETSSELFGHYVREYGSLEAVQPATGGAIFGQGQRAKWDGLTVSTAEFRANLSSAHRRAMLEAGPLLTSSWHQRAPYNDLCPMGYGGRCVVGCVATATAQILDFWQWPLIGFGTHSYMWDGDYSCGSGSTPGGQLTADFNHAYDWANIPDSCDAGCTPAQNAALAQLCSDVGIAHNMDYGKCGSGASTAYAAYVFPTYFKYSSEVRVERRIDFDLPGWFGAIQSEVDAGRPIQYRINSHSIVCDGYRQTGSQYEFHMNYGWGEAHNAWYVLDSLYCYWMPDSLCPAAEEFMVTHIMPQTIAVLQFVGDALTEMVGNGDGRAQAGETIALTPTIRNAGMDANSIIGTLTSSDPYMTITQGTSGYDDLVWGEQAAAQTPYVLQIDPSCPDPHIAILELTVSSPSGTGFIDSILVFMGNKTGFSDNMETGAGFWRHGVATPQFAEQWHLETYRFHSSATSWKMGGPGADNYIDGCDAELRTPPLLLPEKAKLTFWHRIDAEIQDDTLAWDGALVEISAGSGPWTSLTPAGGYSHTLYQETSLPAGTPCYSGSFDWTEVETDLSAYSGVAQIRFRFTSDGAVNYEGWYVDDVKVTGCCPGTSGNVNMTGIVDLADLSALVSYLIGGGYSPPCRTAANVNGQGIVDLADLSALVSYLIGGGYVLPSCP